MLDAAGHWRTSLLFPDIANRWGSQEANNPGLPKNVVLNLRKVMNKEGRLSFERFCAGLKISILRHDEERSKADKRNKVKGTLCTCSTRYRTGRGK